MERYDRHLLLLGPKRHQVLELWEVERYGADSFGDPDHVAIFGMRPAEWHARGVRLLGRTAVECTRDALADAIGRDLATIAATAPSGGRPLVVDPFAGSGNTLHWITHHLPGAQAMGFELDPTVFDVSKRNLERLALPIEFVHIDHLSGLSSLVTSADRLLVAFVAPPWGEALSETNGLDLRRTEPPVAGIVDFMLDRFAANQLLCAIQLFENTDQASIEALTARFEWSAVHMYDVNPPGQNHGVLLGTSGWVPSTSARLGAIGLKEPDSSRMLLEGIRKGPDRG